MPQSGNSNVPPRGVLERFLRATGGSTVVEFALVAPLLVLLAFGTFDFGLAFQQKQRLASAAQAGAQFAVQNRDIAEANLADIEQRVRDDAGDSASALAVAARYYCICQVGDPEIACDSTCGVAPDQRPAQRYVEVSVGRNFDLVFVYPGVADPVPLQATASMRVR